MNSPNGQCQNYCGVHKHGTILRAAKTRSFAKVHEMERRAIGAGEAQASVVSELSCIAAHAREPGFSRVLGSGVEAREEVGHGVDLDDRLNFLRLTNARRRLMCTENAVRVSRVAFKGGEFVWGAVES
jgi:hypothetical protein